MLLTVIVPVFNEAATVDAVLHGLATCAYRYPQAEIIVVDDGSTDGTAEKLAAWSGVPGIVILQHPANRGKGTAIATALAHAQGEITIIQDADLEYDPNDFPALVEPIRRGEAEVVYGSRYLGGGAAASWSRFRLAVAVLNGLVRLLYRVRLTDEATCYKAFRTSLLRELDLQAQRFEFCPEVTAKLCRRRVPIVEVPISYVPRTIAQGKKIRLSDAWEAVWALIKWRLDHHTPAGGRFRRPSAFAHCTRPGFEGGEVHRYTEIRNAACTASLSVSDDASMPLHGRHAATGR